MITITDSTASTNKTQPDMAHLVLDECSRQYVVPDMQKPAQEGQARGGLAAGQGNASTAPGPAARRFG